MELADIAFIFISIAVVLLVIFAVRGRGKRLQDFLYPYPLSSRYGDKMFPAKGDTTGWVAFSLMFVGLLILLIYIGSLILQKELPFIVPMIGLPIFYIGMAIQSTKNKSSKNGT